MSQLTVYEKPTCTTCKNLFTLLTERGIDFERVNYHVDTLPESKIRELTEKTDGSANTGQRQTGGSHEKRGGSRHDGLRKNEPVYKELGLDQREVSDDELISLMAEHP